MEGKDYLPEGGRIDVEVLEEGGTIQRAAGLDEQAEETFLEPVELAFAHVELCHVEHAPGEVGGEAGGREQVGVVQTARRLVAGRAERVEAGEGLRGFLYHQRLDHASFTGGAFAGGQALGGGEELC